MSYQQELHISSIKHSTFTESNYEFNSQLLNKQENYLPQDILDYID